MTQEKYISRWTIEKDKGPSLRDLKKSFNDGKKLRVIIYQTHQAHDGIKYLRSQFFLEIRSLTVNDRKKKEDQEYIIGGVMCQGCGGSEAAFTGIYNPHKREGSLESFWTNGLWPKFTLVASL